MAEINIREAARRALRRLFERVTAENFEVDRFELEQLLLAMEGHWNNFKDAHRELVSISTDQAAILTHDQFYKETESHFITANATIRRLLARDARNPTAEAQAGYPRLDMKLDPLVIPKFDGALHNWLAFKDAFTTLVHNVDYPDAYKLGKLRQTVSVESVPLIGGLYTVGYAEVWKAICDRYDSPKQLAEIHVSRFLNMKIVSEESSKALLMIVDTVQESLRALRVMDLPVDQWDALTVPIVISKLPSLTQREWGMACSSNEIPKLQDLLTFLEKRAHSLISQAVQGPKRPVALQNSGQQRQPGQFEQRSVRTNLVVKDDIPCPYCHGPHRITRCSKLSSMSASQRFGELKNSSLCFNCLKPGHSSKDCGSGGCRSCGKRHHTMFCRDS